MNEFIIKEISNGWILRGPREKDVFATLSVELFLPTIHAVADVLTTWQSPGFIKAASRAKDKWNFK